MAEDAKLLVGRYRLVRELGQGGMGQVWQAQDETLDRPVAVKVISLLTGNGSRGYEARARFLREARLTARLQHPNIVTIHDLGEHGEGEDRVPFLVMELVRGEGLDTLMRRGAASLADAARWGEQIAHALAAAHAAGIMHRDIKPSNILIAPTGTAKVLDFGIARAVDPTDARLTESGFIIGTPPYMAPEQARGFPEPRSDLYALGCLLYQLITGRLPFQAPDTIGYLTAHLTEKPPAPSSVAPGIPRAWDNLILTLLKKDPTERHTDANVLAQTLHHLAQPHAAAPAGPRSVRPRRKLPAQPAPVTVHSTSAEQSEPVKRFRLLITLFGAAVFSVPSCLFIAGLVWPIIWLAAQVPILLMTAMLKPRSGHVLRAAGYVVAALCIGCYVRAVLLVSSSDEGWTGVTGWVMVAYLLVVVLIIARYVNREITTRRAWRSGTAS
ncbi:serine/threonine-protein kinase [Kitasatospora sp. Ki12]